MEEWKTYKLGDLCNIHRGASPRPIQKFLSDKGQPWVKISDATSDSSRFISTTKEFIIEDGIKHSVIVTPGTLIVSNSATPGLPKIMKIEACVHDGWLIIDQIRDCVLKEYLYYSFINIRRNLSNQANGSVFQNLKTEIVKNFEIKIPSLSKQRLIVDVLSSIEDKIELNNRINHNLEQQAQALYKSWFVDFEPFKDGKFVESELGMIPEGWRVGPIYEYANVIYGAPYKSTLFNESGDGLPLIRIRDLKDCSPQFYSPEVLPNTEYVLKGDIVAGMDADFTPYIWKGNKGLLNQRLCKFIPTSDSISRYYIMMLVKPDLEFVSSYKVGTTVSHLGKSDIDKFTVILPPVEIVERYSRIADSILEKIVNNSTEAARLIEQRDSLLPQLMSGKLTC